MANIASEPIPSVPPVDPGFDPHTGIYGFFRRHQKKLLYTVGLFVLLTFSVGGPMLAAVRGIFEREAPMPSIQVGTERVNLKQEDIDYGRQIANHINSLRAVVPQVDVGDGGTTDLGHIYALLRRAAITEGFEVSMAEVDLAIDKMRESGSATTPQQLALLRGFPSLADFRTLLAEAMRIGTLIRLQTLALDNSDARILQRVIADKEKITLKVAVFDEKALDEQLKAAGGITDDDLKKWLEAKPDPDKNRMQVYDTNRVELRFGAMLLADFDAAQWQDEALKDATVGDEQMKKVYEQEKEQRFKNEDKSFKPFDDVKPEVTKLIQSEQVMTHLNGKLRERLEASMKAEMEDLNRCNEEHNLAVQTLETAKAKLAASPEDAGAKEEVRLASEVVPAKLAANQAAEAAVTAKRASFDFPAAFTELTKDKKGIVQRPLPGKRNAEELKDLEVKGLEGGDLGFGEWPLAIYATYLANKGDLSNMPGRSTKAAFVYQVTDIDVRPLKAWDKLKPLLEGAYFTEQAKTKAETQKKLFEAAMLRLAKEKMPEKVAEIEGKRTTTVDEKLAKWEADAQASLAKAEKTLADANLGTQAKLAWTKQRDDLVAQIAKKDEKRKEFDTEVGKQIETDIGEAAKKFHAEVLETAAAEGGFTVTPVGPYPRDLSQKPRFDKDNDPTVVFLFRDHKDMKVGESTGVLQDVTNRRWLLGTVTKVEPLTAADVDRREFESLRRGYGYFKSFASLQAIEAYGQAFTKEALERRYSYLDATGNPPPMPEKK